MLIAVLKINLLRYLSYFSAHFRSLLTLPVQQGRVTVGHLSVRLSVRQSVCPVGRQQQRRPMGLLLSERVASACRYRFDGWERRLQAPALSSECG